MKAFLKMARDSIFTIPRSDRGESVKAELIRSLHLPSGDAKP